MPLVEDCLRVFVGFRQLPPLILIHPEQLVALEPLEKRALCKQQPGLCHVSLFSLRPLHLCGEDYSPTENALRCTIRPFTVSAAPVNPGPVNRRSCPSPRAGNSSSFASITFRRNAAAFSLEGA